MTTRLFTRLAPKLSVSLAAASLVLGMACSQPNPQPPVVEPARPQPAQPVNLPAATLPNSAEIVLELAITQEELANGLMYRPSLASDRGMLLLFEAERYPSIWMKNTLISLDLIYLDNSGKVVSLRPGVPPCAADPCPTYPATESTRAVLEMAAGSIASHGLQVGDILDFVKVPGYPVAASEAEEN